jgi:hypothetical protein
MGYSTLHVLGTSIRDWLPLEHVMQPAKNRCRFLEPVHIDVVTFSVHVPRNIITQLLNNLLLLFKRTAFLLTCGYRSVCLLVAFCSEQEFVVRHGAYNCLKSVQYVLLSPTESVAYSLTLKSKHMKYCVRQRRICNENASDHTAHSAKLYLLIMVPPSH